MATQETKRPTTGEQRDEMLHRIAREAFERHEITRRGDGRWSLRRRHEDGGFEGTYAAEIIVARGELIVTGDIDHVLFAHYTDSSDPERVLRWMGAIRPGEFGYYVCQKARIGTGAALVDEYDHEVAQHDVAAHGRDAVERELDARAVDVCDLLDLDHAEDAPALDWLAWLGWLLRALAEVEASEAVEHWCDALDDLARGDDVREVIRALYDAEADAGGDGDGLERIGRVTSARVYFAWHATRRLCELLDAERATTATSPEARS